MMRFKKLAVMAGTCLALLVLAMGGTAGLLSVSANGGLSDQITVTLIEPVNFDTINVYSEGGQVPAFLPIEVDALTQTFAPGGGTVPDVSGVDFALSGDDPADGTVANADQVVQGTRIADFSGHVSEWAGAIDLSLGTFDPPAGRAPLFPITLVSSATIRALGTIDTSYLVRDTRATSTGFDEFDEATITVNIFDAADIDTNGNDKPDAQGLVDIPSGTLYGQGPSGGQVITTWQEMGAVVILRGGVIGASTQLGLTLNSAGGVVFLDVSAPTLATLQAVDAALNIYDTGRLVVSVASQPTDLVDGPAGVDPLAEFNLTDAGTGAALPAPQNLFALVNILLSDSTSTVNPPEWRALETLPGGLTISAALSGPGVAAGLAAGTEVLAYSYDTTNLQDGAGNLTDDGDQNGWQGVTTTLTNQDPLIRAAAAAGDDTVTVTLTSASLIVGSSAAPVSNLVPAGVDEGKDGLCFIATAAYGTPLAEDINILRRVRDRYLLTTAFGAAFVDTYYRLSPPVAERVADHGVFRGAVRAMLTPVIVLSRLALAAPGLCMAVLAMIAAGLFARRVRRRPARG